METRGHLKVFLGMAAGVGKTVRMLQEGRAELEAGRDVAIGLLETHGRADTLIAADGIERLARRRITYRGSTLEELDLPGVLARAPELCLIDELAHTNAPGVEHGKRFEDVDDVLEAGIDVYSTMNVQHLESLNDNIAELSGVRVRETVPDSVLQRADEIVIVDLTPEALLERLRAGKVYPAERVDAALQGFFKIENLSALRETALRQVAQEVSRGGGSRAPTGPRPRRRSASGCSRWSSPTRAPSGWCGGRGARRSGWGPTSTCCGSASRASRRAGEDTERSLHALRQLASVLGAELLVEEGDDVAETAARVSRRAGHHLHLARRVAPCARPVRGCASRWPSAWCGWRRASTCASSPTAHGEVPDDLGRLVAGDRRAGGGLRRRRRAAGRLAPRTAAVVPAPRAPRRAARQRRPHPAAVHRLGDLPPRLRRRRAPGPRRGRDADALLPGDRPAEPAARRAAAAPVPRGDDVVGGHRATRRHPGVAIDARISRGRTYRDALRRELEEEHFDRVIVSATSHPGSGFSGDDLVWLLGRADAEVLILRPAPEDAREVSVNGEQIAGHF